MNPRITPLECSPLADSSAIKVAIIYEDFATGTRAKHFAERLASRIEPSSPLSQTLWRSDLLESWPIANAATRATADCDYMIVSLRSDTALPVATRDWIEAQLDGAAERHGADRAD